MEEQIKVSVAVPFYNQERYIMETLSSVLNQKTNFNFEIVIGEDCSIDNSRSILAEFKRKYPERLNIIYNEKNLGSVLNEKNILDHCKGKYIALLDGDDLFLDENKLQIQHDFLEENPQYGLVHSDARLLFEDKQHKTTVVESADDYYHRDIKVGDVFEYLLLGNYITACTIFFRRQLHEEHNDFDTWNKLGFFMVDTPMLLEFSKFTKIGYIKKSLATYRILTDSISRPKRKCDYFKFWLSATNVHLYFLNKYGASEDVRTRVLNKYYYFHLDYSLHFNDKEIVDRAMEYFKDNKTDSILIYTYYWAGKSKIASLLFRILRKFLKLFGINLYITQVIQE